MSPPPGRAERPADGRPGERRFPARLFRTGSEPDPRFTLANERTFLAWIRTSLALIAAGVALEALGLDLQPGFRRSAAIVLLAAGLLGPVQAWMGWFSVERALRNDQPLPAPVSALPTAVAVLVAGVLVTLAVLVR